MLGAKSEVTLSTASAIVPGQILLRKYRVEELLGQGGMGVVFAARHLALDERVAIKVLSPAAADDQDALARLQREARILARVRNEHVVRVIDLGQLEDGAPFMVMEHLSGRDLGSLLAERGRLGVELAVGYVLQALVALAAAHANGVVHRDLKPENLFCTLNPDGAALIKVLDFGISRLERPSRGHMSSSMTGPSSVMGTPLYMSPEQLRDTSAVDARSDIWSIGVVLYELVTGVAPFTGASLGDIAIKIATQPPPPLAHVDSSLAASLESVLSRCLRKERDERFANVAELAQALQPFGPAGCSGLVERVARLTAQPLPAAPVAPSRRANKALLLLALPVPLVLVVGWRLAHSHGVASPVPATVVGLVEQRQPVGAVQGVTTSAAIASAPQLAQLANDQPGPRPGPDDSGKNLRAAASSRAAAAKDPCNPPYTVDPQGRKKFRHECFTERTSR